MTTASLSDADLSPHDLLAAARDLVRLDDEATAGLWPRAAALLARQGIEAALARLWRKRAPGLERMSARCQLLCLTAFLGDEELSERVRAAWGGLSDACHHRVYELPPAIPELQGWLETGWALADAVATA